MENVAIKAFFVKNALVRWHKFLFFCLFSVFEDLTNLHISILLTFPEQPLMFSLSGIITSLKKPFQTVHMFY